MARQVSYTAKNILDVNNFLNESGLSVERLAQLAGHNPTSIIQYLNAGYCGNVKAIEAKLFAAMERYKAQRGMPEKEMIFVETSVSKRAFNAFELCIANSDFGVIISDSGNGKTIASRAFAHSHADALLIECNSGYTPNFFFQTLNKMLGLTDAGPLCTQFERSVNKLKDSRRLLIIDEAENLPIRALELARRLHDFCNIGIVLVGMPELLSNLRGGRGGRLVQLFSRVGFAIKLPSINEEDAEALVRLWLPSSVTLWRDFWKKSNANARRLSKLCRMAAHVSEVNRRIIDKMVIEKAAEVLIA